MSITVPLMYDADETLGSLGSEFRKLNSLDRDRGLIEPTIRTEDTKEVLTDTINLAGVNVGSLLENNQNPSEELTQTDAQASLYISRIFPSRTLTQAEKEIQLFEDHDLDPRVRQELLVEATKSGSNMFALESQDFVQEIQQDIKSYQDEANLYFSSVPFTQSRLGLINQFRSASGEASEDLTAESIANLLANGVLSSIGQEARERMRRQKEDKERRKRFTEPKRKVPTTEEKLKKKQEGPKKKGPGLKDEL
jgi:hypothetical protein